MLIFLFIFSRLDETHLRSDGEVSHRTMNHSFVEFIFEDVFLDWKRLFEIIQC